MKSQYWEHYEDGLTDSKAVRVLDENAMAASELTHLPLNMWS